MSLKLRTNRPISLIRRICDLIDKNEIRTWEYDSDGDFTHSALQWNKKDWWRSLRKKPYLYFYIIEPTDQSIDKVTYSIYTGRFVEMLVNHCYDMIESIEVSPTPQSIDDILDEEYEE